MRTVRSHEQLLLRPGSTTFETVNVIAQVCFDVQHCQSDENKRLGGDFTSKTS